MKKRNLLNLASFATIIILTANCIFAQNNDYISALNGKNIVFKTGNTERMRITSNGLIGLGVSDPTEKLEINGNLKVSGIITTNEINVTGATSFDSLHVLNKLEVGNSVIITGINDHIYTDDNADLYIQSRDSSYKYNTIINANNAGRVGIGTINPVNERKLHIYDESNPIMDGHPAGLRIEQHIIQGNIWSHWDIVVGDSSLYFNNSNQTGDAGLSNSAVTIKSNGNVLVGKISQSNSDYKLDVEGKIRADKVIVNTTGADFVFEKDYSLMSLSELEKNINENKHLPGIPSAEEMQKNGMSLGETNTILLQKVEELTLYIIDLQKQNNKLNERICNLESK